MKEYKIEMEDALVNDLINQAYKILSKSDINSERENLRNIFQQIACWKGDGSKDEEFYEAFQKVILSMASLDFSARLPLSKEVKSVQNLISYSINMVNEELEERAFPKALVELMLKELQLRNTVVIGTDANGEVKLFYTDRKELFPAKPAFKGLNISMFFESMDDINGLIRKGGIEKGIEVAMVFGYKGKVTLRIANPSWLKISEGSVYIVSIPEDNIKK
ncbi:MAG: hypothetical protein ACK4ND_00995 [Cytophagaceae bacterium]